MRTGEWRPPEKVIVVSFMVLTSFNSVSKEHQTDKCQSNDLHGIQQFRFSWEKQEHSGLLYGGTIRRQPGGNPEPYS